MHERRSGESRWRASRRVAALATAARSAAPAVVLVMAVLAVLLAPAWARGAESSAPFAGVVLEDPTGRTWPLSALVGHAVMVVVADRSASDDAVGWGKAVGDAHGASVAHWAVPGKVTVVSVADVREVPSFARGTARWMIAQMVEDEKDGGPPRLLDWEGAVAVPIGAEEGIVNVRLYAPDGTLVLADSGEITPDKLARLKTAIDRVLAPAATPHAPAAEATPGGE